MAKSGAVGVQREFSTAMAKPWRMVAFAIGMLINLGLVCSELRVNGNILPFWIGPIFDYCWVRSIELYPIVQDHAFPATKTNSKRQWFPIGIIDLCLLLSP